MKGFLLKPHEAQALAAGKPVVIWRACKPQPECYSHDNWPNDPVFRAHFNDDQSVCCAVCMGKNQRFNGKGATGIRNPFPVGVPLFGKETWDGCEVDVIRYKADGGPAYNDNGRGVASWKPSVRMPEWASRITFTLSDVKVRRPCDVTEEEAKAMVEFWDGRPIQQCSHSNHRGYRFRSNHSLVYEYAVGALCAGIRAEHGGNTGDYWFSALATPQPKNS